MSKRGIVAVAITVMLSLGITAAARATVINLSPVQDQSANDANHDGVWDTPNPVNEPFLLVYNGDQSYNLRVAMEFPLQQIPARAHIDSATLLLKYDGASGHAAKAMRINGYTGDGQLTLADFNVATKPVAPLQDSFDPPTPLYRIDVASFVQSLVDGRKGYAGFMLENIEVIQTELRSVDDPDPANRPLLSVAFTPIPLPPGLIPGLLLGTAVLVKRRRALDLQ